MPISFGQNNAQKFAVGNSLINRIYSGSSLVFDAGAVDEFVNWTTFSPSTGCCFKSVAYGNGTFVVIGTGNGIGAPDTSRAWRSTNGTDWTQTIVSPVDDLWDIAFGDGKFLAVGMEYTSNQGFRGSLVGPVNYTSTDGITWTKNSFFFFNNTATCGGYSSLAYSYRAAYIGDKFVSGAPENEGVSGLFLVSSTGDTGSWETACGSPNLLPRAYKAGTYYSKSAASSVNGGLSYVHKTTNLRANWTAITATPMADIDTMTTDGNILVGIGGTTGAKKLSTSTDDGLTWTQTTPLPADIPTTGAGVFQWYAITYGGGLFIAFGRYGAPPYERYLGYSQNGVNWVYRPTVATAADPNNKVAYGAGKFFTASGGAIYVGTPSV